MNTKKRLIDHDYRSFASFLLGRKTPNKRVSIKNKRLIMDEYGNISINYSNPEVLKGIEEKINEFEDIKLYNENFAGQ